MEQWQRRCSVDVTQAQLGRQVRQALTNLYDLAFLHKHPLARQFVDGESDAHPAQAGEALRQHLLAAIQRLAPDMQVKADAKAWRPYRVLQLRYAEAYDVAQVQQELALSKSQYYREHELGLQSLVALLWEERRGSDGDLVTTAEASVAVAAVVDAGEPRRHNLPLPLTSFVGREQELGELVHLLHGSRLVTLTGSPGIGKTRLAIAVAERQLSDVAAGVHFVDLSLATEPEQVLRAIARVLAVAERDGVALLDVLTEFLRGRSLLLVLDNFEQVLAAAGMVYALLLACPTLTILATSRAPLRLPGEREYAVSPLPLPEAVGPATGELARNPAVALFVQRAQDVRADFALSEDTAASVAAIVRRLDGLPLAIELAAARVRILPPAALLARLDNSLRLLSGGSSVLPERRQTLRAAIQWSYDLLVPEEQTLFRRLAVFAGGCTLEAAEAIAAGMECRADAEPAAIRQVVSPLSLDILDGMTSLVEKSLLGQRDGPDGGARFTMLQLIGDFAREQLDARGEAEALYAWHADYFRAYGQALGDAWWWRRGGPAVALAEADQDNFRAALAWYAGRPDPDPGLLLAAALRFWFFSHAVEGCRWLERLLERQTGGSRARAAALNALATLQYFQGQAFTAARESFQAAAALSRSLGNARQLAMALEGLGRTLPAEDPACAAAVEEAMDLYRELGDEVGIVSALNVSGVAAARNGDLATARRLLDEAVARERARVGDSELLVSCVINRGMVDNCLAVNDLTTIAREDQVVDESTVAHLRRAFGAAVPWFEQAAAIEERLYGEVRNTNSFVSLGETLEGMGELDRMEQTSRRALDHGIARHDRGEIWWAIGALSRVAAYRGDVERAARLFGFSQAWGREHHIEGNNTTEVNRMEHARAHALLHRVAGSEDAAAAYAAGEQMRLEEALALVREPGAGAASPRSTHVAPGRRPAQRPSPPPASVIAGYIQDYRQALSD
jgi:predicted ATPase